MRRTAHVMTDDGEDCMPSDDMPRFSDEQLVELCEDFEQHKADFEEHKALQERRWEQLAAMVEKNTTATERIAEAVEKQAESTAGVVELYRDFQGAARVGVGLRKFIAWVAALGTAGAAVAAAVLYVLDKFMPGSGPTP